MKKVLLIVVSCWLMVGDARAQWVSIPDSNFGTWLNTNGYSACMQGNNQAGWQMDTSCPAVVSATRIHCVDQDITNLTGISYFDNLDSLTCWGSQLRNLPPLPGGLIYLSCSSNRLNTLPSLPVGLVLLDCALNYLRNLPSLPAGLKLLECEKNILTSLPELPVSLTVLNCYNNQLGSLPSLPTGLTELHCQMNYLLTTIPNMPDSLSFFYCNDTKLRCLPILKKIRQFSFYNTNINCLPNYPESNSYSVPDLSSVPLCNANNPYGCPTLLSVPQIELNVINISPNPATNTVTISIDEEMIGGTATLSDITGRKMAAVELTTSNQQLSTTAFANGVYFVTVSYTEGRSGTKKLVISK